MTDDAQSTAALVRELAEAWNTGDADRILKTLHPDFEMHRMKGDVLDRDGLLESMARQTYGAAMKLFPLRLYGRDDRFAVAARIEYRHVEDGALMGATDDGGMVFEVREGTVVLFAPKPTSAEALERAKLTEDDLMLQLQDRPT